MPRIFYSKPSITETEVAYAADAASSSWGENCYKYIAQFEQTFADYVNAPHAVATSSCTGALHIGLAALGIGPGDEVIVPDTTWIATVSPITYLGAKPVFVDINEQSWCIDPAAIETAITSRTKAILVVHLYGNMCAMDEILEIGKRHGIPVIEDAAGAIGSRWNGRHAGSIGAFGVFSFHGSKTVTTGEGGMFVTGDSALHAKFTKLANHGRHEKRSHEFLADQIGFKYKMTDVQAAIGCAQMSRIDQLISRKREIFMYYLSGLSEVPFIAMNVEPANFTNGFWMPTIVFSRQSNITRDDLLEKFARADIDVRPFFQPISSFPMFEAVPENRNSYSIWNRSINLPSYHDISKSELNEVISLIMELVALSVPSYA